MRRVVLASGLVLLGAASALAAEGTGKPNAYGYNYPRSLDAEVAAPQVHLVHYKDAHVMLMEVSNPPGYHMQMHGHPYPSVFARDTDKRGRDLRITRPGTSRRYFRAPRGHSREPVGPSRPD